MFLKDANNFTVNKASTLTTARTINGTSFSGSANITTANWGTARNITIGKTSKSVNGSGNVSWTLSEIGAAPASHTHSYLPLSGGTLTGALSVSTINNSSAININSTSGNINLKINDKAIFEVKSSQSRINSSLFTDSIFPNAQGTKSLGGSGSCWANIYATSLYLRDTTNSKETGYFRVVTKGTTSTDGATIIRLGNNTKSGTAGNSSGKITLYNNKDSLVNISADTDISGTTCDIKIPLSSYSEYFVTDFTTWFINDVKPATTNTYSIGTNSYKWKQVYATNGTISTSDSKMKENIKPISRLNTLSLNEDTDNKVNSMDFYEYVKTNGIYSYNYKNDTTNTIGIMADNIPDNVFKKIGMISKTENEYNEELLKYKRYKEIFDNISDESIIENNSIVEGTGLRYKRLKSFIENEVEPPIRMISDRAHVAMLQEVLSVALNKIEALEEEVRTLKEN